jgi:hypothetical protein
MITTIYQIKVDIMMNLIEQLDERMNILITNH